MITSPSFNPQSGLPKSRSGFTLVELLVVMSIMIVLASVVTPAFNALNKSQDLPNSAQQLQSILSIAKTKASAENRYYWVGLQSESSVKPGTPLSQDSLTVATFSTSRGQFEPYGTIGEKSKAESLKNLPQELLENMNLKKNGSDIRLEGVSIRDLSQVEFANNARPQAESVKADGAWICISPLGEVRVQSATGTIDLDRRKPNLPNLRLGQGDESGEVSIALWTEFGFLPSAVAGQKTQSQLRPEQEAKAVALQISGLTGQTNIYSQSN